MKLFRATAAFVLALTAAGCFSSVRTVTKPGMNFSNIKSVLVLEPTYPEQRYVTDEFARQLLARGYRVRVGESDTQSDVWLQITVSQAVPDKKYLVPLKGAWGDRSVVYNAVTEISGRSLYPSGGGPGMDDAQILVSNATVSISARLLDPGTRDLLWSGSVTYEGLDLDVAVEGSVASLFKRFPLQ